jgi:hypothetical protein
MKSTATVVSARVSIAIASMRRERGEAGCGCDLSHVRSALGIDCCGPEGPIPFDGDPGRGVATRSAD